jgi:hypothetical protein
MTTLKISVKITELLTDTQPRGANYMATQDNAQHQGKKIRLTVDVSPELNQTLEQLAENAHSTKSEILRRAIALMTVAAQAHEKGQKLALIAEDQPAMTEIIGI